MGSWGERGGVTRKAVPDEQQSAESLAVLQQNLINTKTLSIPYTFRKRKKN